MNYTSTQVKQLLSGYVADLIGAGFYLSAFTPEYEGEWSKRRVRLHDDFGGNVTIAIDVDSDVNCDTEVYRHRLNVSLNYSVHGCEAYTENLLTLYRVNYGSINNRYYTEDPNHADRCYQLHQDRFRRKRYTEKRFLGNTRDLNNNPAKLQVLARAVARKTGMENPPSSLRVEGIGRTSKGTPFVRVSYNNGICDIS